MRIMILTSNAMAVITMITNGRTVDIATKIVKDAVTTRITRIIITRIIVMARKTFVTMKTSGNIMER